MHDPLEHPDPKFGEATSLDRTFEFPFTVDLKLVGSNAISPSPILKQRYPQT